MEFDSLDDFVVLFLVRRQAMGDIADPPTEELAVLGALAIAFFNAKQSRGSRNEMLTQSQLHKVTGFALEKLSAGIDVNAALAALASQES